MALRHVLDRVRRMESDGIVARYAIGGAVGATIYLEPAATFDVDIFVVFNNENESALITLTPIYEYLRVNGAVIEGEHIRIGDWPVQFLPASNELLKEAMAEAVDVTVDGIATRVFSAEHLAAIALQTGRAKDKSRVLQFIESGVMNRERFALIVSRHGLDTKWELFKSQFLGQK
jgi:hypothetical protein